MRSKPVSTAYSLSLAISFIVIFGTLGIYYLTGSHAATPSNLSKGIAVSGNKFIFNGNAFTPHGFNSISMLYSQWCNSGPTTSAHNSLTTAELSKAQNTWNANTLRFQVSQPVLASSNGATYAKQIESQVDMVLQAGLVVDISMQDQHFACGPAMALPGNETENAWKTLIDNTNLKQNPNIMFELFNETQNNPVTTTSTNPQVYNWPDWLNGGRQISDYKSPARWSPYTIIGMQDLVNYLRGPLGVNNLLLADGAKYASSLESVPMLNDPGGNNQIAYVIHPYGYNDPTNYDGRWGTLSQSHPVIATEWNCFYNNSPNWQAETATFLDYMRTTVHVGILGHAMDTGSFVVDDPPNACGQLFMKDYTNYFAPSAPTPSVAITTPKPSSTVSGSVSVSANATVASGSITSIVIKAAGTTLKTCSGTGSCSSPWDTTSLANGSYTLEADTTASDGNTNTTTESVTVSNSHPVTISAPSNVASPSQTTSSIALTWQASTDSKYPSNQLSYTVLRNGSKVGSTAAGTTSYSDTGLAAGTYYSYTLTAKDPSGNTSAASAAFVQQTKTPSCATPAAPSGLAGHAPSPTSVSLTWQTVGNPSPSCVISHYVVARNTIPLSSPTTTSYLDTTATPSTTYSYSVLAVETGNLAGPTSSVQVTTPSSGKPDPGPSTPTGVNATAVSDTQVNLTWNASTDPVTGIKGYDVIRNNQMVGTTTTTSFGDSGLSGSTPYSYTIEAVSGGGKTATSAAVNVTTLPTPHTGGGSGSQGGGTTLPPVLQGTTSVGSGSDTGQSTADNPTDQSSSTTSQLTTNRTTNPNSGKGMTARKVAYVGSSAIGVIVCIAAGYWFILRPRRLAWHPVGNTGFDPDLTASSRIVVGDDKHGPEGTDPQDPQNPYGSSSNDQERRQ